MQKILLIIFLCIVAVVIEQLNYGNGGYQNNQIIIKQITKQQAINEDIANRNSLLEIKIAGMKGSMDALEARARYELNLIKPGETLVVLPENYIIKLPAQKNNKQSKEK